MADQLVPEFASSTVKEDLHEPEALAEDVGDRSSSNLRAGVSAVDVVRNGVVAIVKADCPTCVLVAPVLEALAHDGVIGAVYSQDDVAFPAGLAGTASLHDDRELAVSFELDVETVPTLVRFDADGVETGRTVGWSHDTWTAFLAAENVDTAGRFPELPAHRPGCGSMTLDPGMPEKLAVKFGRTPLRARRVELASAEDESEAMYARGWTDGLPVVAPTQERVLRMLAGTHRAPHDVVAVIPPNLVECTVEKVAINAVMAGCLPEYFPVVLAAVEAACTASFNAHGLLATTYFAGPVLVVNGPIASAIGMNNGVNVFGQGNRANSTIGRALQLVIRNVGGGLPGGVDRATFGNPGKVGFCFSEHETAGWGSLAQDRGIAAGRSALTLFAGEGPRAIVDQKSRTADSLARSFAMSLRSVGHPKLPIGFDAILAISPEHLRTFQAEGWDRDRVRSEVLSHLQLPAVEIVAGASHVAEGLAPAVAAAVGDGALPKFRPGGLMIVHCGGDAGMFSAVIGGWVSGAEGSEPVTVEIEPWL